MTSEPRNDCADCLAYEADVAGEGGQCRRFAPVPVAGAQARAIWPHVRADDWCLEHRQAATAVRPDLRAHMSGLNATYRVLYADPPWRFEPWSHRGEDRGAVQHYACLDLDGLCALPIGAMAAPDAALFMWVVQPMIPEALRVLAAWGFAFKTVAYYWIKIKGRAERAGQDRLFYAGEDVRLGLGYHTRAGAEQCWLATRRRGYQRLSRGEPQVVFAPLREHSRKPEEIARSIEALTGDVPRIELFARQSRAGWAAWGNETGKFDATIVGAA